MKAVAALVGFVAVVASQGLSGLPTCAQQCATQGFPAECNVDIACVCRARQFIEAITCCVAQACSPEDQQATIQFAHGLCGGVGIHDLPESATCSTATPGPSVSPTATTTSAPTESSEAPEPTETTETEEPTESPTESPTATGNATPDAASSVVVGKGGILAALAAVFYALA